MDHVKAMTIKFVSSLVLLYVILGMFYGMSFGNVFLITLILGVASYIMGDLLLLPRTNNSIASMADFGLSFIVIWFLSAALTDGFPLLTMSLIAAIGTTIFEWFFHKYMVDNVLSEDRLTETRPRTLQYQTEASEELSMPHLDDEKEDIDDYQPSNINDEVHLDSEDK
ncbi:YndM family protein [Bacillus niameyensis]|uniref:YndM family protein n=1 Tax=Bacillus niameyensis TaxID=1522308 RepID=UPI0007813185|nr:YndM family protein [Bacillus niameyensis]